MTRDSYHRTVPLVYTRKIAILKYCRSQFGPPGVAWSFGSSGKRLHFSFYKQQDESWFLLKYGQELDNAR